VLPGQPHKKRERGEERRGEERRGEESAAAPVDEDHARLQELGKLFDELVPLLLAGLHDIVGQPEEQQAPVLGG
jgi:hypothetical protein